MSNRATRSFKAVLPVLMLLTFSACSRNYTITFECASDMNSYDLKSGGQVLHAAVLCLSSADLKALAQDPQFSKVMGNQTDAMDAHLSINARTWFSKRQGLAKLIERILPPGAIDRVILEPDTVGEAKVKHPKWAGKHSKIIVLARFDGEEQFDESVISPFTSRVTLDTAGMWGNPCISVGSTDMLVVD